MADVSDIEIHVIAPDGVPITLLSALGKAMERACPGATVGACDCRPDCKCSITGTFGKVSVLRSATAEPDEPSDTARAWAEGYTAGWDAAEARDHWRTVLKPLGAPVPQQPANPYPATPEATHRFVSEDSDGG